MGGCECRIEGCVEQTRGGLGGGWVGGGAWVRGEGRSRVGIRAGR